MRILVTGAGAVGGYFGGVLSRSGEDVEFLLRGQQLHAIKANGLRVESSASGNFVVRPSVVEVPNGSRRADLVLFCVKSYHNEQVIETIRPAVDEDTTLLTLQNGLGSGDELARAFGTERVLVGAAYIDATRIRPGVVRQVGETPRIVFGREDGVESEQAIKIRNVLRKAGIDAQVSRDVTKALWGKLIYFCALSGMTCITRSGFSQVLNTPETLDLAWRVMREAAAVGIANGVNLDADVVETIMADFQKTGQDLVSSMHMDLEAGSPLELSAINGAVSTIGKEVGVDTPVNDFITACLTVADNAARKRLQL